MHIYLEGPILMAHSRRRVGILRVLFHLFLICITGGLWLLWLIVRYLLSNSR